MTSGPGSSPCRSGSNAFTLVELLVVIVVLGILATVALPRVTDATTRTERLAFINNLQQFAKAAQRYELDHGEYLEDSNSGVVPTGFEDYIRPDDWVHGTPVGGVWDVELRENGVTSAVGVHFRFASDRKDDAYMTEVDAMFDDGDLNRGGFRKIDNHRYYLILVP